MMHSRTVLYIPVVLIILMFVIAWYGLSKRKDLPFQEVIPLDQGIGAINGLKWSNDDLEVTLIMDNGNAIKKQYNEVGECVFNGLVNNKQYIIEIKRMDWKGMLLYKKHSSYVTPRQGGVKYIVLIGASIGRSWEFDKIGERVRLEDGYIFGNRTVYQFDKSQEIKTLTMIEMPVYAIIIKECSAYFPRDLDQSKKQIMDWVSQLTAKGIRPVLATVVPVTHENDEKNQGKFDSLVAYNDFIRSYAKSKNIPVLDLEGALRISENDRHLNGEYAKPDGSHLLKRAYDEVLDGLFLSMVQEF